MGSCSWLELGTEGGSWTADPGSLICGSGAPPGAGDFETVRRASDVYDAPDGKGRKIKVNGESFFLAAGRKLRTVEPCRWTRCHLEIPEASGGTGWVYQAEGYLTP